jgi:hypothetical protein
MKSETRNEITAFMQDPIYEGFGPTLLNETLEQYTGICISKESMRQIMIEEHKHHPEKKNKKRPHPPRERRYHRGELIQIDGSYHAWLEERGPKLTPIAYIDDATNKVYAVFREQEDAAGYLEVLQRICLTEGIPQSMYMDKRLASRNKKASLAEQLAGKEPQTQFERILEELGIELIPSHSPQAKGRVERLFETLQDRLVKALREAEANSLGKANSVLKEYLPKHNQRFMVKTEQGGSAFVPWGEPRDPYCLIAFKYTRTVKNDNTTSFDNHSLQLPPGKDRCSFAKEKVTLYQHLDGGLTVHYKDVKIARFEHKPGVPLKIGKFTPAYDYSNKKVQIKKQNRLGGNQQKSITKYSPRKDHPWKQDYGYRLNGKLICQKKMNQSR